MTKGFTRQNKQKENKNYFYFPSFGGRKKLF